MILKGGAIPSLPTALVAPEISSGRFGHCRGDSQKRHNGNMIFTVFFVGDDDGRLFAGKTDEVAVWDVKNSTGSRFDLEGLVLLDQVFDEAAVHWV